MKKLVIYMAVSAMLAGCAITEPLQVRVTPLGQEPVKVKEKYLYALPQTVLKVEVTLREERSVPGPYWEYAEKYLGLKEVVKKKSSRWSIWDVAIGQHQELDPLHFYSLNVMDGEFDGSSLVPYLEQGIVLRGTESIHESVKGNGLQSTSRDNFIRYVDMGVSNNFEERTETMYKTIVTDTAFVEVPVQRTVVEQKSSSTKAKEAADFLLELRTRRFEMLTGEYEVYPDGEAMGASIQKLDQMEASYLSLFTGKTITRVMKRTWFIVPEPGTEQSTYPLDIFSNILGFVPAELMEGQPLEVVIRPMGKTIRVGGYFSATSVPVNALLYRLPDLAELKVMLGEEALSTHRISIYQSGYLVTEPIH
ncbi:MAG: DUF4831 family protein [Bacteroidales bacterium]|nr:DUF4831 family protein [Bacteroidales bacterium]